MNSIQDWLNSNRDYTIGVALYQCYGSDALLKDMFRQGFSVFRLQRLVAALSEIASTAVAVDVPVPLIDAVQVVVAKASMPETAVPESKDCYRGKWIKEYQEMQLLRHGLVNATSDKERGNIAHRILSLERHCMYWWNRRDYFLRTGQHMPEEVARSSPLVTDNNKLQKRLINVRTYITKIKKKLQEKPEDPKLLARLAAYESERDHLEQSLEHE